jgi:hypothetical protein
MNGIKDHFGIWIWNLEFHTNVGQFRFLVGSSSWSDYWVLRLLVQNPDFFSKLEFELKGTTQKLELTMGLWLELDPKLKLAPKPSLFKFWIWNFYKF